MENMTAKVSCFARAYHYKNNDCWIFKDEIAEKFLGEQDYQMISENMAQGISFFAPGFEGTKEEALRFIVDHQLSPSVLARSAFCEQHLESEYMQGCRQYIIFASGYDTFAFRQTMPGLEVFHLDLPEVITDREERIEKYGLSYQIKTYDISCNLAENTWQEKLFQHEFDKKKRTFGSLLGISYYLTKEDFQKLVYRIAEIMPEDSAICMDYPCEDEGRESEKNRELAKEANEQMKARYGYEEMEKLLSECGFQVLKHLNAEEITQQYFEMYNVRNPEHRMKAPEGVGYLFAAKMK